jgi:hypothetical protein
MGMHLTVVAITSALAGLGSEGIAIEASKVRAALEIVSVTTQPDGAVTVVIRKNEEDPFTIKNNIRLLPVQGANGCMIRLNADGFATLATRVRVESTTTIVEITTGGGGLSATSYERGRQPGVPAPNSSEPSWDTPTIGTPR